VTTRRTAENSRVASARPQGAPSEASSLRAGVKAALRLSRGYSSNGAFNNKSTVDTALYPGTKRSPKSRRKLS
jgi:hypothetical protein